MKIAVINGTEVKGCTYRMKEAFLEDLRSGNEIVEFYLPKDLPRFCTGCKTCFFKSEDKCPHASYVMPIWRAMLAADLLVFTSPVYALRASGQMKALLDHLCVHWMVHRPDEKMFSKRAAVLTNAIGVFNGGAQKEIAVSLHWMGISDVKGVGVGLMEGVVWHELSEKRRGNIIKKVKKLAARYKSCRPARKGVRVSVFFQMCRFMHAATAKKENPVSADNRHWLEKGWIHL